MKQPLRLCAAVLLPVLASCQAGPVTESTPQAEPAVTSAIIEGSVQRVILRATGAEFIWPQSARLLQYRRSTRVPGAL